MKMRPLHDRLLVKRIAEEEKTKGGLIIPDTAREKPTEARVIAVGEGKVLEDGKLRPLDVHPGDRVLFGKYSGTEIQHLGDEHLIIREDDVLAVLE
jgi:chaperonin GroES